MELVAESLDQRDKPFTRLVAKFSLEKLADVAFVHPVSIIFRGYDDCHPVAREDFGVERRPRREPRSQQQQSRQPTPLRLLGAHFHDAEKRHPRLRGELVEHDVRRVRRHRDEIDTGVSESAQRTHEILDESSAIMFDEVQRARVVDTVDHERGSARGVDALPRFYDAAVIIDRRLRSEAANQSDDLISSACHHDRRWYERSGTLGSWPRFSEPPELALANHRHLVAFG